MTAVYRRCGTGKRADCVYQSVFTSDFGCEVTIKRARNVEAKQQGTFFIRYFLSAGEDKRVQLDTQEISSNSDLAWNQSFSLECSSEDSLTLITNSLKQQTVVLELRFRSSKVIFGKRSKSRIVGRGEVPWEDVFESKNMEVEKWVTMMVPKNGGGSNKGACDLLVQMKIRGVKMADDLVEKKNRRKVKEAMNKCRGRCCEEFCGTCDDYYHVFALGAAFETSL